MRISDWSSDVCSSDLGARACRWTGCGPQPVARVERLCDLRWRDGVAASGEPVRHGEDDRAAMAIRALYGGDAGGDGRSGAGNSAGRDGLCAGRRCPDAESRRDIVIALAGRSEEHTSELQSLMRISYAVVCSKKKTKQHTHQLKPAEQ